eukprot:3940976-Rhodomonas_salina.2
MELCGTQYCEQYKCTLSSVRGRKLSREPAWLPPARITLIQLCTTLPSKAPKDTPDGTLGAASTATRSSKPGSVTVCVVCTPLCDALSSSDERKLPSGESGVLRGFDARVGKCTHVVDNDTRLCILKCGQGRKEGGRVVS